MQRERELYSDGVVLAAGDDSACCGFEHSDGLLVSTLNRAR